jgi:hypothetical protein
MIFGPLFMIVVLVTVIAGVGLVGRWFGTPWYGAHPPHQAPPGRTPLEIRGRSAKRRATLSDLDRRSARNASLRSHKEDL